eukprot:4082392-Alexandrium_andersonii.AAC.1
MMHSIFMLTAGIDQATGGIEYGKISDICFPPVCFQLFDGPSCVGVDMWHILGHGLSDGVPVVGT